MEATPLPIPGQLTSPHGGSPPGAPELARGCGRSLLALEAGAAAAAITLSPQPHARGWPLPRRQAWPCHTRDCGQVLGEPTLFLPPGREGRLIRPGWLSSGSHWHGMGIKIPHNQIAGCRVEAGGAGASWGDWPRGAARPGGLITPPERGLALPQSRENLGAPPACGCPSCWPGHPRAGHPGRQPLTFPWKILLWAHPCPAQGLGARRGHS